MNYLKVVVRSFVVKIFIRKFYASLCIGLKGCRTGLLLLDIVFAGEYFLHLVSLNVELSILQKWTPSSSSCWSLTLHNTAANVYLVFLQLRLISVCCLLLLLLLLLLMKLFSARQDQPALHSLCSLHMILLLHIAYTAGVVLSCEKPYVIDRQCSPSNAPVFCSSLSHTVPLCFCDYDHQKNYLWSYSPTHIQPCVNLVAVHRAVWW